jgi:hypothetical protein
MAFRDVSARDGFGQLIVSEGFEGQRLVLRAKDLYWPTYGLSLNARNIKDAHFAIGCGYSHHHLPKGAPL